MANIFKVIFAALILAGYIGSLAVVATADASDCADDDTACLRAEHRALVATVEGYRDSATKKRQVKRWNAVLAFFGYDTGVAAITFYEAEAYAARGRVWKEKWEPIIAAMKAWREMFPPAASQQTAQDDPPQTLLETAQQQQGDKQVMGGNVPPLPAVGPALEASVDERGDCTDPCGKPDYYLRPWGWGPWDDLPEATKWDIYDDVPTISQLESRLPSGYDTKSSVNPDPTPGGWTDAQAARNRFRWEGDVKGVIHPNLADEFENNTQHRPKIRFEMELSDAGKTSLPMDVGISYVQTNNGERAILDTWRVTFENGVLVPRHDDDTNPNIDTNDGLSAQFYGSGQHSRIIGSVHRPKIIGTYLAGPWGTVKK